jgi:hypothetical protein
LPSALIGLQVDPEADRVQSEQHPDRRPANSFHAIGTGLGCALPRGGIH